MRRQGWKLLQLLATSSLLFGLPGSGCLADSLRDISDELDEFAGDIDDDDDKDFDDVLDDIESWFD